jgi:3-oxoacyl-[acyl-carrier protein] reductase
VDLKLSGKRALVTGSTTGIGEAIARLLAAEGASVAIHGRDVARANQFVDELNRYGARAVFIKADLSVANDVIALAEQARTALGGVDVLVNNAALYPQHTWFESPADEWARLYVIQRNGVEPVREALPETPLGPRRS